MDHVRVVDVRGAGMLTNYTTPATRATALHCGRTRPLRNAWRIVNALARWALRIK